MSPRFDAGSSCRDGDAQPSVRADRPTASLLGTLGASRLGGRSREASERMSDVASYISELRHTVTVAGLNYEIWWVYKGSDTRPSYLQTMNRYTPFFNTSLHAHFVATLVALYRLYETRNDTFNVPKLLDRVRSERLFQASDFKRIQDLHDRAIPLWKKVAILRNKAFGHRSTAHTVDDVFTEAKVSPNELKHLMEITKQLLNEISRAHDHSVHAFNLGAREAAIRLLDDLKGVK